MPVYKTELQTAIQAVVAASRICRTVQGTINADTLEKKDQSPVTIADFASQAVICKILKDALPDDPIVAEEDAAELRGSDKAAFRSQTLREILTSGLKAEENDLLTWIDYGSHDATASRYWTLDPIDGTKGFLRKDQFAVSLALLIDGRIEVAALSCPNLSDASGKTGVIFYAVRGRGAHMIPLDDLEAPPRPVRVSLSTHLAQARTCESFESGHSDHDRSQQLLELLGIKAEPVRMDSQAKYGVLARGDAEIYLRLPTRKGYEEKIWDHAGGVLVVEEAGGRVTDIDGRPLDFSVGRTLKNNRGVVVTNGPIHDAVLSAIQSVSP